MDRRHFLRSTAVAGLSLGPARSMAQLSASKSPNENLQFIVVGTGGRGTTLAADFDALDGVRVTKVFDVDKSRRELAAETIEKKNGTEVEVGEDFRDSLSDETVDVVVIATGNYWHAPAALLAMQHGKHAYVEKPCSHNPHEGEMLVEAAAKYDRRAQHGTQRRSIPGIREGMQRLHDGAIGRVYNAHCYYRNLRPSLGIGEVTDPPEGLNFDLWQGPAPRRPFVSNLLHYNWHWRWHWGNGEIGNNGVHLIDVARMGLGVDFPTHVASLGGRYRYNDDQETPDTQIATFKFPDETQITWEAVSCNRHHPAEKRDEVVFYGENGSASFNSTGCRIFDAKGKEIESSTGRGGQQDHIENFVASIRGQAELNADMQVAHTSATLCHLGNISYRTGRTLQCDSANGRILNDADAMTYWQREYEPGWEPST